MPRTATTEDITNVTGRNGSNLTDSMLLEWDRKHPETASKIKIPMSWAKGDFDIRRQTRNLKKFDTTYKHSEDLMFATSSIYPPDKLRSALKGCAPCLSVPPYSFSQTGLPVQRKDLNGNLQGWNDEVCDQSVYLQYLRQPGDPSAYLSDLKFEITEDNGMAIKGLGSIYAHLP